MKAYLGGAMLGSSVNASVEVVGVISKSKDNDNTIPSLSNSDFTKGEGWYWVILKWGKEWGNAGGHVAADGLIYYDGTTFNGALKGYTNYIVDPFEITYITIVPYVNGNVSHAPQFPIYSSGYDMRTIE